MDLYSFVFRAQLAEQALDNSGGLRKTAAVTPRSDAYKKLGLTYIDDSYIKDAIEMSYVYIAISAVEKSVRNFIETKLQEEKGEDWWENSVKTDVRTRAESRRESETIMRWHSSRGESMIEYTDLGDLVSILAGNIELFEPHVGTVDWVKTIITPIEKSRNVIMHGGTLSPTDIERVGVNIRDWMRQIGG